MTTPRLAHNEKTLAIMQTDRKPNEKAKDLIDWAEANGFYGEVTFKFKDGKSYQVVVGPESLAL